MDHGAGDIGVLEREGAAEAAALAFAGVLDAGHARQRVDHGHAVLARTHFSTGSAGVCSTTRSCGWPAGARAARSSFSTCSRNSVSSNTRSASARAWDRAPGRLRTAAASGGASCRRRSRRAPRWARVRRTGRAGRAPRRGPPRIAAAVGGLAAAALLARIVDGQALALEQPDRIEPGLRHEQVDQAGGEQVDLRRGGGILPMNHVSLRKAWLRLCLRVGTPARRRGGLLRGVFGRIIHASARQFKLVGPEAAQAQGKGEAMQGRGTDHGGDEPGRRRARAGRGGHAPHGDRPAGRHLGAGHAAARRAPARRAVRGGAQHRARSDPAAGRARPAAEPARRRRLRHRPAARRHRLAVGPTGGGPPRAARRHPGFRRVLEGATAYFAALRADAGDIARIRALLRNWSAPVPRTTRPPRPMPTRACTTPSPRPRTTPCSCTCIPA